jgi:hypothetical protein
MTEEYSFSDKEYLAILELTFEVADAIRGKISSDGRKPDSQYLALKLYTHAATAYWLYTGTKVTVPASTGGSSFIDFSSIAVLTRSALETYLSFFEVFVAPKTNDEFEFNYCLWHLSGHVIRENLIPIDPALHKDYKIAQEDIKALRDRLMATSQFQNLKSKQQKDILRGKRKRDWLFVAKSAGFGHQFIRRIYAYYSGFVHADGFTAGQLMSAQTRNDQLFHAHIHLITLMIVLAKFILDYGKLFDEVRAIFPRYNFAYERAMFWSDIAKMMN